MQQYYLAIFIKYYVTIFIKGTKIGYNEDLYLSEQEISYSQKFRGKRFFFQFG